MKKQYKQYVKILKQHKAFKSRYRTEEERVAYSEVVRGVWSELRE